MKIAKPFVFIWLLLTVAGVACNLSAAGSAAPSPAATLAPTASPMPSLTPTITPEPLPTISPTPEFAPICAPDAASVVTSAQCNMPIAEQGNTFCQEKKPYNLVLINKGATYEVLTPGFRCFDNGVKDGKQLLACTGYMGTAFEVSVCDPACVIPTAQVSASQCPPEYNYNNLLGCCAKDFFAYQPSCVTLKLETIRCVVDCSVYNKKATCEKNYVACAWNVDARKCENR